MFTKLRPLPLERKGLNKDMMQGKICMVTGANTGMGKVVAQGLTREGATVVMVCRDLHKGQEALDEIKLADYCVKS
jgi:NAD(P)-dependent dehydrogenase (short-subunit alcohol dehydrogenase family)